MTGVLLLAAIDSDKMGSQKECIWSPYALIGVYQNPGDDSCMMVITQEPSIIADSCSARDQITGLQNPEEKTNEVI